MKLVANAANWYRMYSVQALALTGAITSTLALIPQDWREIEVFGWSLQRVMLIIAGIASVLGIIGRLVDQFSPKAVENA